jgi:hypothetical protein
MKEHLRLWAAGELTTTKVAFFNVVKPTFLGGNIGLILASFFSDVLSTSGLDVNGQVLRQGKRLAAKPTLAQPVFVLKKKSFQLTQNKLARFLQIKKVKDETVFKCCLSTVTLQWFPVVVHNVDNER